MDKVMYCEKCGRTCYTLFSKKCKICGTKMKLLTEDLKQKYGIYIGDWGALTEKGKQKENNFVENELMNLPSFSMEYYKLQLEDRNQRIDRLLSGKEQQQAEYDAKINIQTQKILDKQNCVPKCPTCGSVNVEKISLSKKAVGGAAFGVLSSDIRNTMHCKNCGAKW